jgi:uncharacterized protein YqgC (DUF456 family)
VLPGSVLGILALLEWALFGGAGAGGWIVFAIGSVLFAAGMALAYILTGRGIVARKVPNGSVVFAVIVAIVGMFVVPIVGLFVGFAVGLLASEWVRTRDFKAAASSSIGVLRAAGLGILVEFGFAAAAATVWVVSAWIYFANR